MESDWDYEDTVGAQSTYQFRSGAPRSNLQKWVQIGTNYENFDLSEKLEKILKEFSQITDTSMEGLNGHMSRIKMNLKLIDAFYDKNTIKSIVDIGPGWGALRLYAESLEVKQYHGIDPIELTRQIFQECDKNLKLKGSKLNVSYNKEIKGQLENMERNTLFYVANVLSELSELHMTKYLNFIENNLRNTDYFIIEDWYRKDRRHRLIKTIFDKFYCQKMYINFKNYHITTLLTKRTESKFKNAISKLSVYLVIYLIFSFLRIIRKIKRDGIVKFLISAYGVIRHRKTWF